MTYRYTTPQGLKFELEHALKVAGFANPACTKVRYGAADDGRRVLKTSVFEYSSVRMPLETLEGYERVLRELPGVVGTRIVHDDAKNHREGTMGRINPLRDQVFVTHLRMWDEPDPATPETP